MDFFQNTSVKESNNMTVKKSLIISSSYHMEQKIFIKASRAYTLEEKLFAVPTFEGFGVLSFTRE